MTFLPPGDDFASLEPVLRQGMAKKNAKQAWRAWFKQAEGLQDGAATERWLDQLEQDPDGGPGYAHFENQAMGRPNPDGPIYVRDYVRPNSVRASLHDYDS